MRNHISGNNIYILKEYVPKIDALNIRADIIEQTMGYGTGKIPLSIKVVFDEIFTKAVKIVKPKCGFLLVPDIQVSLKTTELIVDKVRFNLDKIIFTHLKRISSIALFVGTVGAELDEWLDVIKQEDDPLKEYISNLIGSSIAESIAEWTYRKIIQLVGKQNLKYSNRYSPGYCGWSVSEQQKLFSFFPKDFCEIKLLDSGLMLPIKSVSGIVGIGANIEMLDYTCEVCKVPHCYKNRNVNN